MAKVLAVNVNGDLSYCSVPPELRGKGRCNHIAHQEIGESTKDFVERIGDLREGIKSNKNEEFIPYDGTTIETKPYRMTDEEKEELVRIENRMQLDQNINGGYIELNEPLWNDMDKNYFAGLSGISAKNITDILHEDAFLVVESNEKRYKVGKVLKKETALKLSESGMDITLITGVQEFNEFASEQFDFEPTKSVYVLPYYMRIGSDNCDSPITVAYKYLLRNNKNANRQQIAYEALLDNTSLGKDRARTTRGFTNKSLADEFAGKGGVFRAALSGSSIPYSARAVITPTIDMDFGEIKIPPTVAVDIFKPTLLNQLAYENKSVEEIDAWINKYRLDEVKHGDLLELENRIAQKRVIMNRQPSLHTPSLQSFRPKISYIKPDESFQYGAASEDIDVDRMCRVNNSCQIHPLYCDAFGADFDGDTCSLYGINQDEIIPIVDGEIDAKLDINTYKPRNRQSRMILPSKDALFGLINILDKRSK